MSLTQAYPQRYEAPDNPQPGVKVTIPADSPSGTLVAQSTINLNSDRPAVLATQCLAGDYLVIMSLTVDGNPPADSRVPALTVWYPYNGASGGNSYSVEGVTCQGTDVVNGFNITQSVRFSHNGQGVISAGTFGGRYTGNWSYDAAVSVYRVQ
jgi:hypothetical protein